MTRSAFGERVDGFTLQKISFHVLVASFPVAAKLEIVEISEPGDWRKRESNSPARRLVPFAVSKPSNFMLEIRTKGDMNAERSAVARPARFLNIAPAWCESHVSIKRNA
jgi:hypothetical protein